MNTFRNIIGWVSMALMLVLLVYVGFYRFWHQSLTETQLFIKLWWRLFLFIPLIAGLHWGLIAPKPDKTTQKQKVNQTNTKNL